MTSNEDVRVFVAHGDFIDYSMSVTPGGTAPRASTLTFVIDRATGELLDWGSGEPTQLDVDAMGPAESIPPKRVDEPGWALWPRCRSRVRSVPRFPERLSSDPDDLGRRRCADDGDVSGIGGEHDDIAR